MPGQVLAQVPEQVPVLAQVPELVPEQALVPELAQVSALVPEPVQNRYRSGTGHNQVRLCLCHKAATEYQEWLYLCHHLCQEHHRKHHHCR